jgi:hypothetical protein
MPTEQKAYKQPQSVPVEKGSGYPQTDIGKSNIMVKGRWPSDTQMKTYGTARGGGAATKGKKFLTSDNEPFTRT